MVGTLGTKTFKITSLVSRNRPAKDHRRSRLKGASLKGRSFSTQCSKFSWGFWWEEPATMTLVGKAFKHHQQLLMITGDDVYVDIEAHLVV